MTVLFVSTCQISVEVVTDELLRVRYDRLDDQVVNRYEDELYREVAGQRYVARRWNEEGMVRQRVDSSAPRHHS